MRCPHVQYTMPALQYVRHALHCDFGSTSTISHSSVFPTAIIASFDSSVKGLNAWCCWRSLWSACRWGWFSICWIKLWTLILCDRFTIAFGTPEMLKSMFSSPIARLNLFAFDDVVSRCSREPTSCTDSTGFPVRSWTFMTRLSSHFTGFPVRSEEPSSPCNRLPTISREQDVFSSSTSFTVRSPIGLGLDWVGLEDPAWSASPSDCWTSFPTGWCSTVEPDWSFPLVQLWSCFNEIFGGDRGDKYCLSYKTSPVFNLSTFKIQWAGSVPWRMIIRSCLIEC